MVLTETDVEHQLERKKMNSGTSRSHQDLIARHKDLIARLSVALLFLMGASARAEDGYRLWLRYDQLPQQTRDLYRRRVSSVIVQGRSPTLDAIRAELTSGCTGLLGMPVQAAEKVDRDGAIIVGTPQSSPLIARLKWSRELAAFGPEIFRIGTVKINHHKVTVIASSSEVGALY